MADLNVPVEYEALRAAFAGKVRASAGSPAAYRDALKWFAEAVESLQSLCPHPHTIGSCCGADRICPDCHKRIPP